MNNHQIVNPAYHTNKIVILSPPDFYLVLMYLTHQPHIILAQANQSLQYKNNKYNMNIIGKVHDTYYLRHYIIYLYIKNDQMKMKVVFIGVAVTSRQFCCYK